MKLCFAIIITVIYLYMKIDSAHAICAPGQSEINTLISMTWCPFPIMCYNYELVCTACLYGYSGNGLTCTICPVGAVSTNPVSGTCTAPTSVATGITRSLTCSGACPCTRTTSVNSGVITEGPGFYPINLNCQYIFTSNALVTLQFTSFQIEKTWDYVIIQKCTTALCGTSVKLIELSGTNYVGAVSPFFTSDASYPFLKLTFKSDYNGNGEGWIAYWAIVGFCNAGSSGPNRGTCTQCLGGKYKSIAGSSACQICPPLSISPTASTAIAACVCNAGSSGPNGGTCTRCLSGMYKSGTGNSGCVGCPGNSVSPAGSTAVTACLCNAGWSGPNGGPCTQCLDGLYKSGTGSTGCVGCPANSYSSVGSTTVAACVCNAGSNGPGGGPCVLCVDGTYKSDTGSTGCVGCPANSISPAGSIVNTACQCNAGWNGPNGDTCAQCSGGTYKSGTGNSGCVDCPANSISPAGSIVDTVCQCNAGSSGPNGGTCTRCLSGTYKSGTGNSGCVGCPAKSYSSAGSTTVAACVCNAGSNGPGGGPCVLCVDGTYKSGTGSTGCVGCPAESLSPAGSTAVTACVCNAESIGPAGGPCVYQCAAGTYIGTATNFARACGSAQNVQCPATITNQLVENPASNGNDGNLNTMVTISNYAGFIFIIDLGRTRYVKYIKFYNRMDCCGSLANGAVVRIGNNPESYNNAQCTTLNSDVVQTLTCIGIGQYISFQQNSGLINFMELEVFGVCLGCTANSMSPVSSSTITACQCNAGFNGPNGGTCTQCGINHYKAGLGPASCTSCLAGFHSSAGSTDVTACVQCPAGTYFGASTNLARACGSADNSYCPVIGSGLEYWESLGNDGDFNTMMGTYPVWPSPESTYRIDFGQTRSLQRIRFYNRISGFRGRSNGAQIRVGSDATGSSNAQCATLNSELDQTHACNLSGQYIFILLNETLNFMEFEAYGTCVSCPANSMSPFASPTVAACQCNAGYFRRDVYAVTLGGVTCAVNMRGTYNETTLFYNESPVYKYNSVSSYYLFRTDTEWMIGVDIQDTSAIFKTTSTAGVASLGSLPWAEFCSIWQPTVATFTPFVAGTACTPCAEGSYKSAVGSMGCSPCEAGKYSHTAGATDCEWCPEHTLSAEGSDSLMACTCVPGFSGYAGGPCNACLSDTYGPGGVQPCIGCPANALSLEASTTPSACECGPGWTGANGGACALALLDTYKPQAGPSATGCPADASSPPGSCSADSCLCNAGFSGPAGGPCLRCGVGSFRPGPG